MFCSFPGALPWWHSVEKACSTVYNGSHKLLVAWYLQCWSFKILLNRITFFYHCMTTQEGWETTEGKAVSATRVWLCVGKVCLWRLSLCRGKQHEIYFLESLLSRPSFAKTLKRPFWNLYHKLVCGRVSGGAPRGRIHCVCFLVLCLVSFCPHDRTCSPSADHQTYHLHACNSCAAGQQIAGELSLHFWYDLPPSFLRSWRNLSCLKFVCIFFWRKMRAISSRCLK